MSSSDQIASTKSASRSKEHKEKKSSRKLKEKEPKDKKEKEKSKSKSKLKSKSSSSRKHSRAAVDTDFSRTAYIALPVTQTASSSAASPRAPSSPNANAVSNPVTPRTAASLDAVDKNLYAAQGQQGAVSPRAAPASALPSLGLAKAPSAVIRKQPASMYGAFTEDQMGVLTEPASPTPKAARDMVPSAVSLPHLMGRKLVQPSSPGPQTYTAAEASPPTSAVAGSAADCVDSDACLPGYGLAQGGSVRRPEPEQQPETLSQRTARAYANDTAYSHFFKSDAEVEQEKRTNMSNRARPASPTLQNGSTESYESVVYYGQENVEPPVAKADESDSDSDSAPGIGYSLPEDLAGKSRVEGLLLRLDKRLRKLESKRRKKVDSDDESEEDDSKPEKPDLSTQDHLYSKRFQQIVEVDDVGKFVTLASLGSPYFLHVTAVVLARLPDFPQAISSTWLKRMRGLLLASVVCRWNKSRLSPFLLVGLPVVRSFWSEASSSSMQLILLSRTMRTAARASCTAAKNEMTSLP